MNIEELRSFCLSLPAVTEDIKWGNNLVISVADKMFCLADLDPPFQASFKVREEEFEELAARDNIIQAPYFARMKWVKVMEESSLTGQEWEHFLRQSYELVISKLPKKTRESISNDE
jgi:predicted DNA-binding protein (MmcQ/YjbR family)